MIYTKSEKMVQKFIDSVNALVDQENEENENPEFIYIDAFGLDYLILQVEIFRAMDVQGNWVFLCNTILAFNHEKGSAEFNILMHPDHLEKIVNTAMEEKNLARYKELMIKRYEPNSKSKYTGNLTDQEMEWVTDLENYYRSHHLHLVITPQGKPEIVKQRTVYNDSHAKYWSELPIQRRKNADTAKESLAYDQAMHKVLTQA